MATFSEGSRGGTPVKLTDGATDPEGDTPILAEIGGVDVVTFPFVLDNLGANNSLSVSFTQDGTPTLDDGGATTDYPADDQTAVQLLDSNFRVEDSQGMESPAQALTINLHGRQPVELTGTPIADVTLEEGSGAHVIDATPAFSGSITSWSKTGPALLSIDAAGQITVNTLSEVPTTTVTITAENELEGAGGTKSTTFDLTITAAAANQPPAITTEPLERTWTEGITVFIPPSKLATDPDGDTVSLSAVSANASINADGNLQYTVPDFVNGTDTITYTVSDGQGGTADGTINVTIEEDTTAYTPTPTSFLSSSTYIEDATNKFDTADGSLMMVAFEFTPNSDSGGHDLLHLLTDDVVDAGLKFYQQGGTCWMILPSGATTGALGVFRVGVPLRVMMTIDGSGAGSVRRIVFRQVGEGDWQVAEDTSGSAEGLIPLNSAIRWSIGRSAFGGNRPLNGILHWLAVWDVAPDIRSSAVQRYFDTPGGARKDPSVAEAGVGTPLKAWYSPEDFAAEPGANGTFAAP